MHYKQLAVAALPVLIARARAHGQVEITNQCDYSVNLWSCADQDSQMHTVKPSEKYTESYNAKKDGGGISIKIAINATSLYQEPQPPVTQLEYTLGMGRVWYDVSNINGYPFMDSGLNLTTSDGGGPVVKCPAGVKLCAGAYNKPDDNQATGDTADSADLLMVLCADGSAKTPGSEGSVSVGFESSTAAPVASSSSTSASVSSSSSSSTSAPVSSSSVAAPVMSSPPAYVAPAAPAAPAHNKEGPVTVTITAPVAVETVIQQVNGNVGVPAKRHEHRHAQAHAGPRHPHAR